MSDRKRMRRKPQSYEDVLKRPSRSVWPGCGDGRKRWCGLVNNFGFRLFDGFHDNYQCWRNRVHGCPRPCPEVGETYEQWSARAHAAAEGHSDE